MEDPEDNGERTKADSSKYGLYDPDSDERLVGMASGVEKIADDGDGRRECLEMLLEDVM